MKYSTQPQPSSASSSIPETPSSKSEPSTLEIEKYMTDNVCRLSALIDEIRTRPLGQKVT
jgi:hypothetical protein